jgi:hypothetical protein
VLLQAHQPILKQDRVYQRVLALVLTAVFVFARHTISPLRMALGLVGQDGQALDRLFRQGRFRYGRAREGQFEDSLTLRRTDAIRGSQGLPHPTQPSGLEAVRWLPNGRTSPFRRDPAGSALV